MMTLSPARLAAVALAVVLPVALYAGVTGAAPAGPTGSELWLGSDASGTTTTLADVRAIINASSGPAAGLNGQGIGIALIDTGVAAVPGLPAGQVVNGPDLSFESQSANLRYLDTYGHGTHM